MIVVTYKKSLSIYYVISRAFACVVADIVFHADISKQTNVWTKLMF